MTKGLRKDLRRSIGKSFSRFLSILLISALGVAFFAGVRTAAPAMEASADATYDDQNLMDIRVLGTLGMTTEDVAAFLGLAGVEDAEGLYTADYLCETDIATVVVKVSSMTNRINQVRVTEGRFPERYDECIVDRAFLDASGYALGDTVRLRTGTEESVSDKLAADEFTIVGIGETAYYMDADRGTASIGDGTGDGMMIVPKEAFTTDIFSEVLVTMTGADELNCFSADYEALLETVTQNIESLEQGRCEVRLEQFKADADDQLNDARYEYQKQKDKAMRDLSDAYQTLTASEAELTSAQAEIEQTRTQLQSLRTLFNLGDQTIDASRAEVADARKSLNELEVQKQALEQEIADSEVQISEMEKQLQEQAPTLSAEEYYQRSLEIIEARATVEYYKSQMPSLERSIESARRQVETAEALIENFPQASANAREQIAAGEAELAEAEKRVQDGEIELERAKEDYAVAEEDAEAELAAAEERLQNAEDDINNVELPQWYVLDRSSVPSCAAFQNDAQNIRAVGTVFPIIFFLVAALVSLTTMTRMVEEERTQIGTLKALGYGRRSILSKYIVYALISTLIGAILGAAAGEALLPGLILRTYRIVYPGLTETVLPVHLPNAGVAAGFSVLATVGGAVLAGARVLPLVPASLMRPEAPQSGQHIALEELKFIWLRLNFSQKAALRNLFRYKKRLFMTVFGVAGCMALLLVGFGISDSVERVPDKQYGDVFAYQGTVGTDTSLSRAERRQLLAKVASVKGVADYLQASSDVVYAETDKGETTTYLVVPQDTAKFSEYVRLQTRLTNEPCALSDDGVLITEKFAKLLGLEVGDMVTLKADKTAVPDGQVRVAGIVENYLNHYIYMTPNIYEALYGETATLNAALIKTEAGADSDEVAAEILEVGGVTSVTMNTTARRQVQTTLDNLTVIIAVLIVAAGLLAFIVLYNLNNINITERRRELATLKVLGFFPRELAAYVYRENVILTLLGTVLGLGLGYLLHWFVMRTIATDMVMYSVVISPLSVLWSVLITLGFSAVVNGLMYFRLKKIDMIESLKSVE